MDFRQIEEKVVVEEEEVEDEEVLTAGNPARERLRAHLRLQEIGQSALPAERRERLRAHLWLKAIRPFRPFRRRKGKG